jgi:hypothetical protein
MCKEETKPTPEWTPEKFPEPRTVPKNWNAAAFEAEKEVADEEIPEDDWKPEPFPEPRMFPWGSKR